MTFRNNQKYKQTLNIQIEQSPPHMPQNLDQHLSNFTHPRHQSQNDDILQQDQGQEMANQSSLSHDESAKKGQNSEDSYLSQRENDDLIQDNNSDYNQGQKCQDYLILQNSYAPKSIYPSQQCFGSKNPIQSDYLQRNKLQESQKDQQVEKIIQDVLYKRKQKQKQKQLLQNILNSQKKSQNVSSLFTYQPKQHQNPLLSKLNQNINFLNHNQSLRENYQLLTKCKQLESKIKLLAKKKYNIEKERKSKEQTIKDKQKKAQSNKTKQQLSLEKLEKRLQKALMLNSNLSKRVKLQKSKLSSFLSVSHMTINSKKNINSSIDQQSTIKHVENSSRFNQSVDKNNNINTHRSGASEKIILKGAKSPSVVHESSASRESDGLESQQNCKECHKKSRKDGQIGQRNKNEIKQKSKTIKGYSPTKYKSPILQFNSYLIDSEMRQYSQRQQKQNIYIEDDMIQEESSNLQRQTQESIEQQKKRQQIEKQRRQKEQQLKELIRRFQILSEDEKRLLKRIQDNGAKIKEFENQQYQQAIC